MILESHDKSWKYYIEAKGGASFFYGSNRIGKPYTASQVFNRVAKGFFATAKISQDIDPNDKVGLAIPDTPAFKKYVSQISEPLKHLKIGIILVSSEGKVLMG